MRRQCSPGLVSNVVSTCLSLYCPQRQKGDRGGLACCEYATTCDLHFLLIPILTHPFICLSLCPWHESSFLQFLLPMGANDFFSGRAFSAFSKEEVRCEDESDQMRVYTRPTETLCQEFRPRSVNRPIVSKYRNNLYTCCKLADTASHLHEMPVKMPCIYVLSCPRFVAE